MLNQTSKFCLRQCWFSTRSMSSSTERILIKSGDKVGPIEDNIISKIEESLTPAYLKVGNDSAKHAHHAGMRGASNITESHFTLDIVSSVFTNMKMPERHRCVYRILNEELLSKGVHALQIKAKTPQETNGK